MRLRRRVLTARSPVHAALTPPLMSVTWHYVFVCALLLVSRSYKSLRPQLRVLVLLSGGLDSTSCIHFFRERGDTVEALFIDHGQPAASKEKDAVSRVATHYHIPLHAWQLRGPHPDVGAIPGRNAVFVFAALGVAPSPNIISLGIHAGTTYADCSPTFVDKTQEVLDLYSDGATRLLCPFLRWSKLDIWQYAHEKNVPINATYSCEAGTDPPCGACLSCLDRSAVAKC